jgi:hypothetical protein
MKKFILNKFNLIFFFLTVYYFIIPSFFLIDVINISTKVISIEILNYLKQTNISYYISYSIFSLILQIIIFLYLKKIFNLNKDIIINDYNIYKYIFNLIIFVCIIFVLKDIILILKYYANHDIINRSSLYYSLLNNRKTYLNLLIIFSIINFKDSKILSYLSFFFIIIYSILTLSRIELLVLFLLHFLINVRLNKNLIILFLFILFFILTYRYFIFENKFSTILTIFTDGVHLMISSYIFLKNLALTNLADYILQNFFFLLKDFFYFPINLYEFFIDPYYPIKNTIYSIRGIDSVICYFLVFLIYFIILAILIKNFFINKIFLNSIFIFLVISLFRGNFVHNLNFVIKIYLLVIFLSYIFKYLNIQKHLKKVN